MARTPEEFATTCWLTNVEAAERSEHPIFRPHPYLDVSVASVQLGGRSLTLGVSIVWKVKT